jgi:hypothetical protein
MAYRKSPQSSTIPLSAGNGALTPRTLSITLCSCFKPSLREKDERMGTRMRMNEQHATRASIMRAVFTDIQFWIPALVLAGGILLLAIIT